MKVSFIIPVYNAERYLPRLIASLEVQTSPDWEALFTDDGSADRSIDILQAAAERDCRIKLFSINHEGSSVARNMGLDNATGELIGFIDADDFVHPELVAAAEQYLSDSSYDCLMFDYARVNPNEPSPFIPIGCGVRSEAIHDVIWWALNPWQPMAHVLWRFVYRRSVVGDLRFYPRIKHQDLLFSYQIWGSVRNAIKLNHACYAYVEAPGSIIRSAYSTDKIEANSVIIRELSAFYHNNPGRLQLLRKRLFPRMIANVWKQSERSGDPALLAAANAAIRELYRRKLIGFGGFSLSKKIKLLRLITK